MTQAIMQYMEAIGGPAVMYVLIGCSILLVTICLERFYVLSRSGVNGDWLLKQIVVFISHNRPQDAIDFCKQKNKWALARVFETGLHRSHCSREDILDAMSVSISDATRSLEANLSILGTIAVIAPFVGLFGTVLGITQAFDQIAKQGKTGIETVGAGVAEALVTTAAGLLVAIVAVVAFNAFKSKIKRMIGEITDFAQRLGEIIYFKQTGVTLPADIVVALPAKADEEPAKPLKG